LLDVSYTKGTDIPAGKETFFYMENGYTHGGCDAYGMWIHKFSSGDRVYEYPRVPCYRDLEIISYLLLTATAGVMILTRRKIVTIKATYHFILVHITITATTIHGILALAMYL
jgi:hypothetical protein